MTGSEKIDLFAQVIVDIAHSSVDRLFTYRAEDNIAVGQRVLVPFGAGNKSVEGFVLGISESYDGNIALKSIIRPMEPYTVLTREQIRLAYWIKQSYNCVLVDALRLMIPAQLRGGRVKEKTIRTVKANPGMDSAQVLAAMLKKDGTPKSPRQHEVYTLLAESGMEMSTGDICAFIPGAPAAIRALLQKGYILEIGRETYRDPYARRDIPKSGPLPLSPQQKNALCAVSSAMEQGRGEFLLHGVTGSGKTEVYMQAIAKALDMGGTAIVLVPEISLTPQAMDRFRGRFGNNVAVLHSRLSPGERYDEWRRIRLGRAKVVLGARSAVFAPLENIKLIVVDEEHEQSYSSEITPRYNAIEVARQRCRLGGGTLVLGSATPSIATYLRATKGKYTLLEMPHRINGLPMPRVEIADMRAEFAGGNTGIFSAPLYDALKTCLDKGEQAILFMNRRGYSTFVSCRGCGYVFKCDNCDVSMTYHKLENAMKCHYCGCVKPIPKVCPECGKPYIKFFGIGTQQVEEQLKENFPGVTCLRMDADTTRTKDAHYSILSRFAKGEAQVLIGTQMVAKGLDMPGVSVVGVIAADASLHIPDYRSCERSFQLLTQVAGRAGRASGNGRVIVQTYNPEHPAVVLASRHDYKGFFDYEIAMRRAALFPPYSLFIRVLFVHGDPAPLAEAAESFADGLYRTMIASLKEQGADERELLYMTCGEAPIKRRQGHYRMHIVLKLARTKHTPKVIEAIYAYANDHRTEYFSSLELNPGDLL
ncbi:MAG: primosomal protein N' [Clostridia bacterium]|nr:primosomal protein N' [Clostridia bacterium]MBQ6704192.1 primosomal protein N' [Clostridia bacterium]